MDHIGNTSETCCECFNCSDISPWKNVAEKKRLVAVYFWLDGIFRCVIAGCGILGNYFAIRIFSTRELRSTFNMFLVVLAIFDMGYLFLILLEEIPQIIDIKKQKTTYPDPECELNQVWLYLYPKFIHPMQYVFLTASEYFTVIISLDRFIAIKYPLRYYSRRKTRWSKCNYLEQRRSKKTRAGNKRHAFNGQHGQVNWKRVLIYFVSVLIFSFSYCVPVFFEYESDFEHQTIKELPMVQSEVYVIGYYLVLDCIFRFLIPVCLLLYTNYGIYKVISKKSVNSNDTSNQRKAQNFMLFGVVLLLLIVHVYRFCFNMYQVPLMNSKELYCCGKDADNQIIHIVAYCLLTLSCSGNCFVYAYDTYKSYNTSNALLFKQISKRHTL